ncbi:hypothetical protein CYMTET_38574 [Cymbomonas tetramitiformis]|uniref:VTT domain-containing protein n=1 Tax=Cymbomonas tetramitiformis TaxID=36881 RepID=A0AAE0F546_9CHLO|nr:hypothetical protein CYMTET_38574 [Cymbomonas tetramitiformis]
MLPAAPSTDMISNEDQEVVRNTAAAIAVALLLIAGAAFYSEDLSILVTEFAETVAQMGTTGYLIYMAAYIFLEVVAIPSFPLAWGAVIFGKLGGGAMIVVSATVSATLAFLFSRYIARDRILPIAEKNEAFSSVNTALNNDAFRIVFLLRLSPVIPGAIANYFYGVTTVELAPYIAGTAFGEVPGAIASISAGTVGQTLGNAEGGNVDTIILVSGVAATVAALSLVNEVATKELKANLPGVDAGALSSSKQRNKNSQ